MRLLSIASPLPSLQHKPQLLLMLSPAEKDPLSALPAQHRMQMHTLTAHSYHNIGNQTPQLLLPLRGQMLTLPLEAAAKQHSIRTGLWMAGQSWS